MKFRLLIIFIFFLFSLVQIKQIFAAVISAPPNIINISSGLIGYWTFDGKDVVNGTAKDKSTQNNDASLISIATTTFYSFGKTGQAFNFDGVNDTVETSASTYAFEKTNSFSFSLWFKNNRTIVSGTPSFLGNIEGGVKGYIFGFGAGSICTNTKIGFALVNNSTANGLASCTGADTSLYVGWHHAVITYDGLNDPTTSLHLYIDGVERALVNAQNNLTGTTVSGQKLRFGDDRTNDWYNGNIDDLRIYNRVLTSREAQQLYNMSSTKFATSYLTASSTSGISSGLVGYWTFDGKDMISNVADKSGQGNRAYYIASAGLNTSTTTRAGKIGQAMDFDGTDDRATTTSDFIGTNALSISAWMKTRSLGGSSTGRIIDNGKVRFYVSSPNTVSFSSDASTVANSASNVFATSTWTFITVTRNSGGTANIYVNGVLSGSANQSSGTPVAGTSYVIIGATSAGDSAFDGLLDDIRVYTHVLSVQEITQLYSMGQTKYGVSVQTASSTSGISSGLVGYWTFDGKDMVNGVAKDKSGNGNNGNLINIATTTFYRPGKIGQGFNFDGVNDMVNSGSDFVGIKAITASVWVYPRTYGQSNLGRIIDNGKFILEATSTNNTIGFSSDGFATQTVAASNALPLNKWTHVVVIRDSSGTTNFYINSVLSGSANQSSGTPTGGTSNVIVGNVNASTATFNGPIDDVRIYNRALSATEIQQLYNMGR